MKTYIVEGGIGKAVAFTALIPELAKDEKIQIYTPYVDVFAYNPMVHLVMDSSSIQVFDPRLITSERVFREVYKGNFINGKSHLIQAMCDDYGIEYSSDMKPQLYTDRYASHPDYPLPIGKYCIVQFSGGQPAVGDHTNQYQSLDAGRNLHSECAQGIIDVLPKDLTIIDFSLPNEPAYEGADKLLRPFAWYHEALKNAEFHISIDSCLNHFSGSTSTKGVTLWGSTKSKLFGYDHNVNLDFELPNYIEPETVLAALKLDQTKVSKKKLGKNNG